MKPIRHKSINTGTIAVLLLLLSLSGCMRSGFQVVPVPNRDVLVLDANEVVQILRAAGFSNEQILEYGPSIRDGLARSGAVRILINKVVEAGFAVKGDDVYISTRSRGYFIYNINTGWVNMQAR
ncbi:MAG: hypothetical protein P8016_06140 [Sedimentisphaerales bacterium]